MKLQDKEMGDDLELDMSPMIDMVFLLLIFFIVASQIVDPKPQVEIPEAAYGKISEKPVGRLMVTVQMEFPEDSSKDEVLFYVGSHPDPVDIETVQNEIERHLNDNEKLKVLIRADAQVPYAMNELVTRACANVGAQDLIYSVFEE